MNGRVSEVEKARLGLREKKNRCAVVHRKSFSSCFCFCLWDERREFLCRVGEDPETSVVILTNIFLMKSINF